MSLTILSALYGQNEDYIDVVKILRNKVLNGELRVPCSNSTFNEDPCPQIAKELRIVYNLNGEEVKAVFAEGTMIQIPKFKPVLNKNRIVYNLEEVTLSSHCWGNTSYLTSLVWAYLQFNRSVQFGSRVFFIAENIDPTEYEELFTAEDIRVVKLPSDFSLDDYNKFLIKDLNSYINTDYVLTFQNDGFIANPNSWSDEFLDYDYIGAPWWYDDDNNVGNGGFSLRSKRLLEVLASDDHIDEFAPEDHVICRVYGDYLKEKHGIKFAPESLASKFSVENGHFDDQFGFHGKWNLDIYLNQI